MMSYKGKTVLVTGGAGFIGSHFCDRVVKTGIDKLIIVDNLFLGKEKLRNITSVGIQDDIVTFIEEDITNYNFMKNLLKMNGVDVVFNFAVIPLLVSLKNPHWSFMENIKQVANMTRLLYEKDYKTLIHVSSSEAYGTAMTLPMTENHPTNPTTPYAASKSAGDDLIMSYHKTHELDVSILRPFNNYGPRQNEGLYAGVIPATIKRIFKGKAPIVRGTGIQGRDYVYVDDTVEAIIRAYTIPETRGEIINIASGKELPINHIIKKICELTDYDGGFEFVPRRKGDVSQHLGCTKKCQRILNYTPHTPFDRGLQKTVDYYKWSLNFGEHILNSK